MWTFNAPRTQRYKDQCVALSQDNHTCEVCHSPLRWTYMFPKGRRALHVLWWLRWGSILPFQKGEQGYKQDAGDRFNLDDLGAICTSSLSLLLSNTNYGNHDYTRYNKRPPPPQQMATMATPVTTTAISVGDFLWKKLLNFYFINFEQWRLWPPSNYDFLFLFISFVKRRWQQLGV
jgi:hypothetical protein